MIQAAAETGAVENETHLLDQEEQTLKKQLLCTSAIALGVAAAPAMAQDWNMDWGGYMDQHIAVGNIDVGNTLNAFAIPGYATASPEGDGVDFHSNTEIWFLPNITLDNGLSFGINVQFEGNNPHNVDESYVDIKSDTLGKITWGSENSAGYKMMVGAPGVTSMYINSPSTSTFIPFTGTGTAIPFRQAALSSYTEVAGNNDVERLTYYTPDFNGLTIGVSYTNQGAVNAGNSFSLNKDAVVSDIFDIGVNYSQSFGATDITLAARYGRGSAPNVPGWDDPETWGVGAQVGFNNLTIGGSYAKNDNGINNGIAGFDTQDGWSFGATYDAAGPWSFEALTYQGTVDNWSVVGSDLDREAYRIGASRDLGPGVDWDIYLVYEERDDNATPGTDVKGTVLGTAINLNF